MSRIVAEKLVIEYPVIGLSRSFRSELLVNAVGGLLRRGISDERGARSVKVRAIDGLSFTLERGDCVGLLGHNGSGKTTLLRVLAGLYLPTSGSLEIEGKTMPLLSLGCGTDGDFTGYENIVFYGLYLGLTKREIAAVTSDIAEFTELGSFLKLPTRTYSAGMLLRLYFAVATSVKPDILLVDEVFGAGDAAFFTKARRRMESMLSGSNIVVLATHSTALIGQHCNKVLVLDHGQRRFFGPVDEGLQYYKNLVAERQA